MSKSILDTINDVFVLSLSGVPYYAMCFGGETCKSKPDHLLQSGFIVAMFSFAQEFGQKSIINVEFQEGRMVFGFRKVKDVDILVVFFTTTEPRLEEIREIVEKSSDLFVQKFGDKIYSTSQIINVNDFTKFTEDLISLDLVNKKPMGDISMLIDKQKQSKKSFFSRFLRK